MMLQANALALPLADETVQCVVTSPPYYGLRDYKIAGQIGLEQTPAEYVAQLVAVFREVWRVLRPDGVVFLNLGDSYAANRGYQVSPTKWKSLEFGKSNSGKVPDGYKPKDLLGIPWRVAFALQDAGWWLRSDTVEHVKLYCPCGCGFELEEQVRPAPDREIIWHKPNPMPESVTDRPTKAHEYVFMLTKSARYYWDAQAVAEPALQPIGAPKLTGQHKASADGFTTNGSGNSTLGTNVGASTRNLRSVWTIASQPYSGAHFATMPPALAEKCIRAGTSDRGCCPECGAPWARVIEKTGVLDTRARRRSYDTGKTGVAGLGRVQPGARYLNVATGWRPGCGCYGVRGLPEYPDEPVDETGARYPDGHPVMERHIRRVSRVGSIRRRLLNQYAGLPTVPCLVLDPFGGAGTTALVAAQLHRRYVTTELNADYIRLARERLREVQVEMPL